MDGCAYHSRGQPLLHAEPSSYSRFEVFQSPCSVHPVHHRVWASALPAIHVAFAPNAFDPFPIPAPIFAYTIFDDAQLQL